MKRFLLVSLLFFIPIIGQTMPPAAEEVFQLTAKVFDPNSLILEWKIKSGYFLYRDRIHLTVKQNENFHVGDIHFQKTITKTDKQGKNIEIYRNLLTLPVPVLGSQAGEGILNVAYQGCSDDGFCYPPQSNEIKLSFNDLQELTSVSNDVLPIVDKMIPQNDEVHQLFSTRSWPIIFLSFFGFGLLLAFTPCVLPMIPVLSGIIVGQGKHLTTHKAFLLSLSYVLSMAITYSIIGATVALIGSNLQIAMQSPWAIGILSGIFILLALSMFNFYDLKLPSSLQHKLAQISHSKAGGFYLGAIIMGSLSTLILSPCVTAPLIGALGYIANTGDIIRGSLALFCLGLGMGTPLLIIGTSAGKWVPKAGVWMHEVKGFFGLLLLGVAINLLSRLLPPIIIMAIWGCLLIFTGIYAGALEHATSNEGKFRQGAGIIFLIYGILILIGGSQGNINPLQPLSTLEKSRPNQLPMQTLTTLSETKEALLVAKTNSKPVLIDFYADWCSSCKYIQATTLHDPTVIRRLESYDVLRVDITKTNDESRQLLNYFKVIAPPTFLFYDQNGLELRNLRLEGNITTAMLINSLIVHHN